MAKQDIDINTVLSSGKWAAVQDHISNVFGMAVITVDYKCSPVTDYSHCTPFCEDVMKNSVYRKRCFKCSALAGLEAARLQKPYICLCHCGLVEAAVPVMVGENYLGAVLLGQVRISDRAAERLLNEETMLEESEAEELSDAFRQLPVMSMERLEEITELVSSLVQYVVDKSVDAHTELQTYEWMLRCAMPGQQNTRSVRSSSSSSSSSSSNSGSTGTPELRSSEVLSGSETKQGSKIAPGNPVYPAINYVETHRHQMVGMREMAALCHLSPSYFSKLFLREVGENFTDWVNRRKIAWAKELLREGGTSITAIGTELGYMDTSYFIKVFKKFEGITPLVYRQHKFK